MTVELDRKGAMRIALCLALAMALTRFHHFGSALHLPDASWAVFLLGGFYLRRAWLFGAFLAEAALIDFLATTYAGASDWCITPAYAFLLPSYGSLWLGGLWFARRYRLAPEALVSLAVALLGGVAVAFLISNGSFYLLSGYFPEMSLTEYATRVAKYFPRYLSVAAGYVGVVLLLHVFLARRRSRFVGA